MMEALPRSSAVVVDAIPVFLEKVTWNQNSTEKILGVSVLTSVLTSGLPSI